MMRLSIAALLVGSTCLLYGTAVSAQDIQGTGSPSSTSKKSASVEGNLEEVVVTGSRLVTNGNSAPTPTTVISADELTDRAPTNIADALNRLPQFSGSVTNSRPSYFIAYTGNAGNYLNLRNLGTNRVLVLFDGVRVPPTVPSASSSGVDVNILPQALVKRVDVVTGGASAVYGSQAVSGVVNYILDKDFTGLKASAQGGVSGHGDAISRKFTVAGGTSLLDGRVHLLGSAEYFNQDGILSTDRPIGRLNAVTVGAGTAALPYTTVSNARAIFFNGNGVIFGGPLTFQQFGPNGTTVPFNPGKPTLPGSFFYQGGDGGAITGVNATAGLKTTQIFSRASLEVTNNLTAYIQGTWSESVTNGSNTCCDARFPGSATALTVFSGNPFLSPATQAALTAANTPAFQVGRVFTEESPGPDKLVTSVYRSVKAGLEGSLGSRWKWDTSLVYGQASTGASIREAQEGPLTAALDSVRAPNGQIVCRVTLTNPNLWPGCVPLNIFGPNTITPQMMAYYMGYSSFGLVNEMSIANANLRGDLLDLWAGPLSAAVGGEYRRESFKQTSNSDPSVPFQTTGLRGLPAGALPFMTTNVAQGEGAQKVKEGYVEALLPLAEDLSWAKEAALDAALRVTNYSTSGTVNTWKVGLNYQPVTDVRLRGTISRDIAAPSLFNLFGGQSLSPQVFVDPHTNTSGIVNLQTGGNPNLKPEVSTTRTAGIVYTPSRIPGLSMSVDYYNISITNAILNSLDTRTAVLQCDASNGTSPLCARIIRPLPFSDHSAANYPTLYINSALNESVVKQAGIDFELGYLMPLSDLNAGWSGDLTFRTLGTVLTKKQEQDAPFLPTLNLKGSSLALTDVGNSTFSGTFSVDYHNGRVKAGIIANGFTGWKQPTQFVYANDSTLPGTIYVNLHGAFTVMGNMEIFGNIDNLFDKDPPVAAGNILPGLQIPSNRQYDIIGRYFTVGVRFRM